MRKYMIVYDLERRGESYEPLLNALRQLGAEHVLYSKWVLRTNSTAAQLRDYLKQFIDANDLLLVVGLTGEAAWTRLFVSNEEFKQAIA
jgi:CRISPR/Cas system-associated endoribonuclease Cas2